MANGKEVQTMQIGASGVKKSLWVSAFCILHSALAFGQPVRITQKPEGLVHGMLYVPASVAEDVARVALYVNSGNLTGARGRSVVIPLNVADYIRRLPMRVAGYIAILNVIAAHAQV